MLLVNSNSIVQLYAYGTNSHTIRVRLYHMRIRVRYVPYAYGMKYAYGTQQTQSGLNSCKQYVKRLTIYIHLKCLLTTLFYLQ